MTMYKQCLLSQGQTKQVAWIEERGAKRGASVELKDGSGFWTVDEVYHHTLAETVLKEKQRMDRNSFASIQGQ